MAGSKYVARHCIEYDDGTVESNNVGTVYF